MERTVSDHRDVDGDRGHGLVFYDRRLCLFHGGFRRRRRAVEALRRCRQRCRRQQQQRQGFGQRGAPPHDPDNSPNLTSRGYRLGHISDDQAAQDQAVVIATVCGAPPTHEPTPLSPSALASIEAGNLKMMGMMSEEQAAEPRRPLQFPKVTSRAPRPPPRWPRESRRRSRRRAGARAPAAPRVVAGRRGAAAAASAAELDPEPELEPEC